MDIIQDFLDKIGKGNFLEALRQIYNRSDFQFDKIHSEEEILDPVLNYIDASIYPIHCITTFFANENLQKYLEKEKNLLRFYNALKVLRYEIQILDALMDEEQDVQKNMHLFPGLQEFLKAERTGQTLSEKKKEDLIESVPLFYRQVFRERCELREAWIAFREKKPLMEALIREKFGANILPWHKFNFVIDLPKYTFGSEIPVVFMEPLEDFANLVEAVKNGSAILVFESRAHFFQVLWSKGGRELIFHPDHLIYILDIYPNEQFCKQIWKQAQNAFQSVFMGKNQWEETLPLFLEALEQCLKQSKADLQEDSESSNWLFEISKRYLFRKGKVKFGKKRAAAFQELVSNLEWHDTHKFIRTEKSLGPTGENLVEQKLEELAEERKPRKIEKGKKPLTVVHVVPQLGNDFNHALTRLLKNLFMSFDKDSFIFILAITERLSLRKAEYPYPPYTAPSTLYRAQDIIDIFRKLGVKVFVTNPNDRQTFEDAARQMVRLLHDCNCDIAVFHGPDIINNMCAQITDVPIRVMFDHGVIPTCKGYDAILLSSEDSLDIYKDQLKKLNTEPKILPFCVDVKKRWLHELPKRENFGLPENAFIMTTISNHLENRVTLPMKKAIVEILKRNPNAVYAPIGYIYNPSKFLHFFKMCQVDRQVVLMGFQDNPGQMARMMNLYLNEHPIGSGLGILDAMASGIPVVTMYDEESQQQASRYGGTYIGIDRSITNCQWSDYVGLTCKLIQNEEMYNEWRQHASQQYDKHSDVEGYVKRFEKILKQLSVS